MENEISPGVKVRVRVRDDAPTKQSLAPQQDPTQASPFRGKCPVRTLGDGGASVGQAPSSDPAASPSPGAPSVADAPAPPKGGAKNEASPALRAHFERLCAEAEALHRAEPGFDLNAALHDPRFLRLTAPGVGVPVADAWYALHRDEYAEDLRRESMERAAAAVAAGRLRPREGGRTSGGELMGTDPRHMSPAQRAELKERIKRGEKVYPGV